MFRMKMILNLLFICSIISCTETDIYEMQIIDSKLKETSKGTKTKYYVSQWSNTNPLSLGLKETLAMIASQENSNVSEIQLTADINCGSDYEIEIPSNTTINGGGSYAYGENGKKITTSTPSYKYLFIVTGENVTFINLKIKGPWDSYIRNSKHILSSGIFFDPNANNGQVLFCEISGFPGAAICFRSIDNIVYGNNIHNNYMIYNTFSGFSFVSITMGYGVFVEDGGSAVIHHNYFNNNQHAIAGGGKNSSGIASSYVAYKNNVKDSKGKMRSHHFDMHGNATDSSDLDAGNTILIYDNVFFYDANRCNAIHVRGVPQNYASVYHNIFVNVQNCDINYAVRQISEIPGNQMNFRNMYVFDNVVCGWAPPYNQGQWTPGL